MLTVQEWNVLSEGEQKARESEMPDEIRVQKEKEEHDRLINANIEKDRKLKAAEKQIEELNVAIEALKNAGAPSAQVQTLENIRKQYEEDFAKDPLMANARLAATAASQAVANFKKSEQIKRTTLRKLQKDYPKDMEKYGDELDEILDKIEDSSKITPDSILIMFNSLRGKSIDDQLKEAEARGAQKALEDAGVVAVASGGSSGTGEQPKTSLTKEQEEERVKMGLEEKDYKEILRGRQEKDKIEGRTPRILINPKH